MWVLIVGIIGVGFARCFFPQGKVVSANRVGEIQVLMTELARVSLAVDLAVFPNLERLAHDDHHHDQGTKEEPGAHSSLRTTTTLSLARLHGCDMTHAGLIGRGGRRSEHLEKDRPAGWQARRRNQVLIDGLSLDANPVTAG
jgi:hypothetical protein